MSGVEERGQGHPYGGTELTTDQAISFQKKNSTDGSEQDCDNTWETTGTRATFAPGRRCCLLIVIVIYFKELYHYHHHHCVYGLHVCLCTTRVSGVHGSQKSALYPPEQDS